MVKRWAARSRFELQVFCSTVCKQSCGSWPEELLRADPSAGRGEFCFTSSSRPSCWARWVLFYFFEQTLLLGEVSFVLLLRADPSAGRGEFCFTSSSRPFCWARWVLFYFFEQTLLLGEVSFVLLLRADPSAGRDEFCFTSSSRPFCWARWVLFYFFEQTLLLGEVSFVLQQYDCLPHIIRLLTP